MIKVGEKQTLTVVKKLDFGIYLHDDTDHEDEERILLPIKQVPEDIQIGNTLEVFVYRDSSDRLIATTNTPLLTKEKPARLVVAEVNKNGAYLKWGLEKDLFLPFREQTRKVRENEEVLVSLYVDKSKRLCATMNVYKNLRTDSPYKAGDDVTGTYYEKSDSFGLFIAVDDLYSAIIPKHEAFGQLTIGDRIKARVTKVREDGKLNLSIRDKAYIQMYDDMNKVLDIIEGYNGVLPFTEKASPEVILRETGMSKNEFKRAVGHLYKERKITIQEGVIRLVKE